MQSTTQNNACSDNKSSWSKSAIHSPLAISKAELEVADTWPFSSLKDQLYPGRLVLHIALKVIGQIHL